MYEIEKSPLYGLQNKKKLASYLGIDYSNLILLLNDNNYNTFDVKNKINGKIRQVEEPKPKLKLIHKKILKFLSRIKTPDYLYSSKKKCDYISNAREHLGKNYITTVDINKFYNSTKARYVFKCFLDEFKMSEDVAWLITDILTYCKKNENNINCLDNAYLPTGSPTSQIVAFFAYKKTFDWINEFSIKNDITFTLFVDDMTFSSNKGIIDNKFVYVIQNRLNSVHLSLSNNKTKIYKKNSFKKVTGCIVPPNSYKKEKLLVPNDLRDKIKRSYDNFKKNKNNNNYIYRNLDNDNLNPVESLFGMISAANRIDNFLFYDWHKDVNKFKLKVIKERIKIKNDKR